MNKLWNRTARHKNSNEAGKHRSRLRFSSGGVMLLIIILILGAMAWL
ncbi:hypothetical protein [Bacteriophage Eos]|nr:hypothetical protein [Bacteriophage Eos]